VMGSAPVLARTRVPAIPAMGSVRPNRRGSSASGRLSLEVRGANNVTLMRSARGPNH
jgi:hypothetical protein